MASPQCRCLIAGGGPAGIMAGYLLARAGIEVTVLEKHRDFLRDFRGDTIHPSTLGIMDELGLLDEFLKLPHQKVERVEIDIGDARYRVADLSHLPAKCKYIAFMPQWDFLNFMAAQGRKLKTFTLMMEAEATGLTHDDTGVTGATVKTGGREQAMSADLVIGADGRHSVLREASGLPVEDLGAPMDVLWFRLPVIGGEDAAVFGKVVAGQLFIMLYRGDYWQCALIIRKGSIDAVKAQGLDAFHTRVAALAGRPTADAIKSWDDVKLLTVAVDRLNRWALPGLLFIGDAAHAMSPIGGVGINLAVQDAVAAANILAAPLAQGRPDVKQLDQVQMRRWFPTRATQGLQVVIQNNVIAPILESRAAPTAPWQLKLAQGLPWLQRLPARIVGLGFRPEHVRT